MADLTFTIESRIGKKAHGTLKWPAKNLSADCVSGDSTHDAIPLGTWTARRNKLLDKNGEAGYCDRDNNCWMQAFDDKPPRTDLGIHPDGGVQDATLGCIAFLRAGTPNTKAWYNAFFAVPAGGTTTVEVVEA